MDFFFQENNILGNFCQKFEKHIRWKKKPLPTHVSLHDFQLISSFLTFKREQFWPKNVIFVFVFPKIRICCEIWNQK